MSASTPTLAEMAERQTTLELFRNGFAHDCQNLLLPVATLLALVRKRQELDSDTRELLQIAMENLRIVRDFLGDASRMYTREALQVETVTIDSLIKSAVTSAAEVAARKPVAVVVGESGLAARADRNVLPIAIRELLKNAVAAAPAGSRVEITTQLTETGVRIDVVDTGPGVPEDQGSQVFRPFFRSNRTGDHANGGFGLGLVQCQAIAIAHGGAISYSRRDNTTCFSLLLPAA